MNKSDITIPTRKEIEEKISKQGDYVKIDFLTMCLKKSLDFDTKKYVLNKLALIYESRAMFVEAGRLMRNSADINTTFDGKISDFMKSFYLFVKGGNFEEADVSFNKALALGNQRQKEELKLKRKSEYMIQAKDYLKRDKRKNAMIAFEKLLEINLTDPERKEVQNTLLDLYEKLGKIREFYNLKRNFGQPQSIKTSSQFPLKSPEKKSFLPKNQDSVDDLIGIF